MSYAVTHQQGGDGLASNNTALLKTRNRPTIRGATADIGRLPVKVGLYWLGGLVPYGTRLGADLWN
jgi:hypothetical protein